jgi:hypothetical protein
MTTTVGEMTPSELSNLIESIIEQKLMEILGDPDSGLELQEHVAERLRRQQTEVSQGERGLSLEEVRQQLSLK